jgi:DNA-binding IclR family transcriptional regulator
MIQSLERAFKILELLNSIEGAKKGLGGLAISKRLGLKHPTVHNFLKSLDELGYVEKDPETSKFRLGQKALHLGLNILNGDNLNHLARPIVKELVNMVHETAVLTVFDQNLRHTVLVEESSKPIKISINTFVDNSFYATSTGRAILSCMSSIELDSLLEAVPLPMDNSFCPKNREDLDEVLNRIRARGYELIDKGYITVVGAPIYNKETHLYAALGLYFPTNGGLSPDQTSAIIQAIKNAAAKINSLLSKNG